MRSAPKLDDINEEDSEEEEEEVEEEEEEDDDINLMNASYDPTYHLTGDRLV